MYTSYVYIFVYMYMYTYIIYNLGLFYVYRGIKQMNIYVVF